MSPGNAATLSIRDECKAILGNALPVGMTYIANYASNILSASIVGHLGANAIAAAALATTYANATGYAILYGVASAIDTLGSQAKGAGNLPRVGQILHRGTAVLLALALPVGAMWLCCGKLLAACGQDPALVAEAQRFITLLLWGMPAVMSYEAHKKTLQAVGDVTPPLVIAGIATFTNASLGSYLVHGTTWGLEGAAIANAISQWVMLFSVLVYFRWHRQIRGACARVASCLTCGRRWSKVPVSAEEDPTEGDLELAPLSNAAGPSASVADLEPSPGAHEGESQVAPVDDVDIENGSDSEDGADESETSLATQQPAPSEADSVLKPSAPELSPMAIDDVLDAIAIPWSASSALGGWPEFLSLGAPSAAMLVAEWSSYEVGSIISGLHGIDTLAAHNVISTTAGLLFMVGLGVSVAASIRIGQRLGEHRPDLAKLAYRAVLVCMLGVMAFNACITLAARSVWARVFTDDPPVVDLVTRWLPLLALYSVFDCGQCISSGVLKGVGRPGLAAFTNVVAYCVISLPLCQYLCNTLGWGLPGVWSGFTVGVSISTVFLTVVLSCLNWQRESDVAHARAKQDGGAPAPGGH